MSGRLFFIILAFFSFFGSSVAQAASPWPASPVGNQVASGLNTFNVDFEASGVSYLSGYGYIINGDDGDIAVLSDTGTVLRYWFPGGDLEDVTLTDTSAVDHIIYIANESGSKIEAFNLDTGAKVANKSWTLSDLPVSGGLGFEALAYVPAAYAPASWGVPQAGGFFVAASQAEALLRIYNINTNASGASVSSIAQIPVTYSDVGGLHFNVATQLLYVLFDSDDKIKEYSLAGNIINSYQLPTIGNSDEGVAIVPDCAIGKAKVAITNDAAPSVVYVYNNYPITCPAVTPIVVDSDNDGYSSQVDCNDADVTVHTNQIYYQDADNDGLGNLTATISICSSMPPAGYVANNTDQNDADHDNDGASAASDCNDNDPAISANQIYYADLDHDGLGDPNNTIAVCTFIPPNGYVTNHNDVKDQPAAAVPDVPVSLFVKKLSARNAMLSWDGKAQYYTVRLTDLGTSKTKVFDKIIQTSKTLDSKYILAKHSYRFSVRACSAAGCSKYSNGIYFNSLAAKQSGVSQYTFRRY